LPGVNFSEARPGVGVEARLVCVECGASAEWPAEGWEAHLVRADLVEAHLVGAEHDVPDYVFIFCPDCARREFHLGDDPKREGG